MESVPKEGHTMFIPLTELIKSLDKDTYDCWNRAWMVSDRRSGPIHPLIYKHPITGKQVCLLNPPLVYYLTCYYILKMSYRFYVFIWE